MDWKHPSIMAFLLIMLPVLIFGLGFYLNRGDILFEDTRHHVLTALIIPDVVTDTAYNVTIPIVNNYPYDLIVVYQITSEPEWVTEYLTFSANPDQKTVLASQSSVDALLTFQVSSDCPDPEEVYLTVFGVMA